MGMNTTANILSLALRPLCRRCSFVKTTQPKRGIVRLCDNPKSEMYKKRINTKTSGCSHVEYYLFDKLKEKPKKKKQYKRRKYKPIKVEENAYEYRGFRIVRDIYIPVGCENRWVTDEKINGSTLKECYDKIDKLIDAI